MKGKPESRNRNNEMKYKTGVNRDARSPSRNIRECEACAENVKSKGKKNIIRIYLSKIRKYRV